MAESSSPKQPTPVWKFAIPFAILLVLSIVLSAAGSVEIGLAMIIAATVAGVVSVFSSPKFAAPMLLLAVLTWSAQKSDLSPITLIQNRDRAGEYLFGRSLTEAEHEQVNRQAERTTRLSLRADAQKQVLDELGLDRTAEKPENFDQLIEARYELLRSALTEEEWDKRVSRSAARAEHERRGGFFPIETGRESVKLYIDATLETIAIAIWGTLIAFVAALPVSLLASQRSLGIMSTGTSLLHRIGRWLGSFLTRRGFDSCRGFNEFVLALIFVAVIGLGPFAGVLALAVHTFGVLGKVFADAIDTIRQGEVEGVLASGAPSAHVISYAVLPQVFPIVISQTLLRFESNVRSASVLGLVGAGGVGFLIDAKLKSYQFQEVATIMLIIIILVSMIDFGCSWIVRRFV
ncbi:MAG: ABC transporter permease subunit [Phycisphaerales bacterium]|nr:ABC transporter permease subunit [Phycisphaerales bacterium]